MSDFERVQEAAAVLRQAIPDPPECAIVLGSGLGDVAEAAQDPTTVPCDRLPHWPRATVAGHADRLVAGRLAGRPVVMLVGRVHAYEGHDLASVVFPVRVMARVGVRCLILTNAAGGIREDLTPGALMVIDDHLNLIGGNPLRGPNDPRFGERFPDMSEVYSSRLRALADDAAAELGMRLPHGVYAAVAGPSYETPAEVRALRAIGADAVGMSTVPEAIAARHLGLEVLGLSLVANQAAGGGGRPLAHTDVLAAASRATAALRALLSGLVGRL